MDCLLCQALSEKQFSTKPGRGQRLHGIGDGAWLSRVPASSWTSSIALRNWRQGPAGVVLSRRRRAPRPPHSSCTSGRVGRQTAALTVRRRRRPRRGAPCAAALPRTVRSRPQRAARTSRARSCGRRRSASRRRARPAAARSCSSRRGRRRRWPGRRRGGRRKRSCPDCNANDSHLQATRPGPQRTARLLSTDGRGRDRRPVPPGAGRFPQESVCDCR